MAIRSREVRGAWSAEGEGEGGLAGCVLRVEGAAREKVVSAVSGSLFIPSKIKISRRSYYR